MTLLLLLVFSFYTNGLSTDPFWADEMYAVDNTGGFDPPRGPAEIISSVTDNFPDHVPLFFLLGAAWAHFVGWTQYALRAMPILVGILLIAWMYRLGSDLFSRKTGVVAATLLGTSAYAIMYVHDFRMYSLFLMLATMHCWLYQRLLRHRGAGRMSWWLHLASTVALLYTHLFSLIFFAGLLLYHLLFCRRSTRWRRVLLNWTIGALLFMPYLPVLVAGIRRATTLDKVTSKAGTAAELVPIFFRILMNGSWAVCGLILLLLILVLWQKRDLFVLKLITIPATMLALILLANAVLGLIPLDRMRYFIILWAPCTLLIAYSLTQIPRLNGIALLALLLWIANGYKFYRSTDIRAHIGGMSKVFLFPPMQDWVYWLRDDIRAQDYLLGFSPTEHVNQNLELGRSVADYYTHVYLGIDGAFIQERGWGEWLENNIVRNFSNEPYLLFMQNPQDLPSTFENVFDRISARFVPCDVVLNKPELLVQRYVLPLAGCDHEYQPIHYDNGISIVDHFGEYDAERHLIRVVTGWEIADEQQLFDYNISYQIMTPDWEKHGQVDEHLYHRILKWHYLDMPTDSLPPGDYRLVIIVYGRYDGRKVTGTALTTGERAEILPLLHFTVES